MMMLRIQAIAKVIILPVSSCSQNLPFQINHFLYIEQYLTLSLNIATKRSALPTSVSLYSSSSAAGSYLATLFAIWITASSSRGGSRRLSFSALSAARIPSSLMPFLRRDPASDVRWLLRPPSFIFLRGEAGSTFFFAVICVPTFRISSTNHAGISAACISKGDFPSSQQYLFPLTCMLGAATISPPCVLTSRPSRNPTTFLR